MEWQAVVLSCFPGVLVNATVISRPHPDVYREVI
jgi:hypothetical protein